MSAGRSRRYQGCEKVTSGMLPGGGGPDAGKGGELLDPVVHRVGDVDLARARYVHAPRVVELAGPPARPSEAVEQLALRSEDRHPAVAELRDVETPLRVECQVIRVPELARRGTDCSPHAQQLSVGREHLDPV